MGETPINPEYYLGKFGQRPITTQNVKELIEFFWYSVSLNRLTGSAKVLSSSAEDHGDYIKHTLYETQICGGDWGLSDSISLFKSVYIVDKNSGKITASHEQIKSLAGKYNPGPIIK